MRNFLLIGLFVSTSIYTSACNTCGGAMSSFGDQTFQLEKNYIGLNWTYFAQDIESLSFNKLITNKIISQQFTLVGSYSFKEKYNLTALMPVYLVSDNGASSFLTGDAILNFRYRLYKSPIKKLEQATNVIYVNSGIKIPIGSFIHSEKPELNNISYSTKSVDFLLGASYNYEKNNKGINVSFNTKINLPDDNNFQRGHSFVLNSALFAKTSYKQTYWTPYAGITAEYITKDISNGFVRPYSGGKALYASLGFNMMVKKFFSLIVNPEIPIVQDYSIQNGSIQSKIKININTKILF